jgi:hypothetical protein
MALGFWSRALGLSVDLDQTRRHLVHQDVVIQQLRHQQPQDRGTIAISGRSTFAAASDPGKESDDDHENAPGLHWFSPIDIYGQSGVNQAARAIFKIEVMSISSGPRCPGCGAVLSPMPGAAPHGVHLSPPGKAA